MKRCATLLLLLSLASAAQVPVTADGQQRSYEFLAKASKPWRVCLLLPHGKDQYWWGVAWGANEQAKQLGIKLGVYQAGGYEYLETQRQQWLACRELGADAYVLGAIQSAGLRAEINQALADKKPVIDLINGVDGDVTSRSVVSFAEMAAAAANHAAQSAPPGRPMRLGWFPGPAGVRWVQDASAGLLAALHGKPVHLVDGGNGPTDTKTQASLVREAEQRHGGFDVVLGNAVAIEFATRFYGTRPEPRPKLVSLYATNDVIKRIREGSVLAAPTDQPVLQARIGIDLAVRALQGEKVPGRVSPTIVVLDRERLKTFDLARVLPPVGQWMVQQALPPR